MIGLKKKINFRKVTIMLNIATFLSLIIFSINFFTIKTIGVQYKTYPFTISELEGIASMCKKENGSSENGMRAEASLMANLYERSSYYNGSTEGFIKYITEGGWFSTSEYYYNPVEVSTSYVLAVKDVLVNGNRYFGTNINEHDCMKDILSVSNNGVEFNKYDRSQYIKDVTVIENRYGAVYKFYCFPDEKSDPFGYKIFERKKFEISKKPNKTTYIKGDTLDTEGLEIKVEYSNGEQKYVTTGFSCDPETLDHAGIQEITVNYGKSKAPPTFEVTVLESKKDIDMTGVKFEDKTVTYNGKTQSIEIQGELPEGIKNVTYEGNSKKNAGTYKIIAKFEVDTTLYNDVEDKTATLTINKADPKVTPVYDNTKTIYEGNKLPDISLTQGDTEGTISWDEYYLTVGTQAYGWTFVPTDTGNYNSKTGKISLTIAHDMKDATCLETPKCKVCGYTEGKALGHSFTNYVSENDATCTQNGTKTAKCDRCEVTETIPDVGSILPHDMKDATCLETPKCKVCGYTEGKALGHSFTNYVSENDATCTQDGTKTAKCDRCEVTDTIPDVGSMLPHDMKDATCLETPKCKVCGYTEGDALGHNFTNYVSENDATCTQDGTKTAKCDRCEVTDTIPDVGSMLPHDMKDATCLETPKCKVCGWTEGEALGHSFTNYISENDATCTQDGTKTAKCDRCEETDTITDKGSMLPHNYKLGKCVDCGKESPKIAVISQEYDIKQEMITRILPKTKASELIAKLQTNADKIEIYDKENNLVKDDETIATGMTIGLQLNGLEEKYSLVVVGDLNGDGEIGTTDFTTMTKYRIGVYKTLNGIYLEAADIIPDGKKADNKDIFKLARILIGLDSI